MSAIDRENARDVLSHLLSKLCNPTWGSHHQRYRALFNVDSTLRPTHRPRRDIAAISDLLFSSMRDEVFEIFAEPSLKPRQETIRAKAGDISESQRGIYLHIIEGTDNKWRFFVGQSDNLSFRIRRQHQNFRYRRDHPSFHYHAMQNSRWDYFVILAVLPPGPPVVGFTRQEQGLLLNILWMWCALLFCTLQPSTMTEWHGYEGIVKRPWTGLNLACPLDHGGPGQYVNWRHALSESEDPLAKSYVTEVLDGKRALTPGGGLILGLSIGIFVAVWIASLPPTRGGRGRGRAW